MIQEIHHRFTAIGQRATGAAMAEAALDVFGPVLPVTDTAMRETTALVLAYPALSARDLVHVAACSNANVDLIVSPDRGFDTVEGLGRVDPTDAPSLLP